MRQNTPFRLAACLALGLIPLLAGCGSDAAKDASQKAQAAVEQAGETAREQLEAAGASAKAATEAAKESLASAKDDVEAALGTAAESVQRFMAGSKDELVDQVEVQLANLDVRRTELEAALANVSEAAKLQMTLVLAKLDTKRKTFETKLAGLKQAGVDKWAGLQPDIEERLGKLEADLDKADAQLAELLGEQTQTSTDWHPGPPKELFEVVKVVDGDTIHIKRGDGIDKLRLLSVDTEEKLSGAPFNESKPETLYGEETKLWAIDYFAGLAGEDGVTRVGVLFPNGEEEYDVYGRLLCHVILPDGTDYNLKLVEEGRSPYFMKYGYSRLCHGAFEAAEERARAAQLGVWNPETNKPANANDPWHKRDYDSIVPWWRARAQAIKAFREQKAQASHAVFSSEDEEGMAAGVEFCEQTGYLVSVFGAVDRTFEEADGSLTLLLRALKDQTAFRAHIPAELRPEYAALDLENRTEAGKQNYLFVVGELERGSRGFDIWATDKFGVRLGAPDPIIPE